MNIKNTPEPIAALRARLPAALAKVWNAAVVAKALQDASDDSAKNKVDRPGLHPENVFDFEDGIPLIVSVEAIPTPGRAAQNQGEFDIKLHVSASIHAGSLMAESVMQLADAQRIDYVLKVLHARAAELTGVEKSKLEFLMFSAGGIPHWYAPWEIDHDPLSEQDKQEMREALDSMYKGLPKQVERHRESTN